jgi:hypothetical protein
MNKSILVSAEKLRHNILKKKLLHENINSNLLRLNNLIEGTYKDNKNVLFTRLPISFDIPENINEKEFTLEFYYNLIDFDFDFDFVLSLALVLVLFFVVVLFLQILYNVSGHLFQNFQFPYLNHHN